MQSVSVRSFLLFTLAIFAASLLAYSAFLFADDMVTTEESPQLSDTQAPAANTDSLYAIIQQDFQRLEPIWKKACYDCHSDKTDYPWYYKLPFVKGMIDDDITEARAEVDMSNGFPFVSNHKPVDDLRKLGREVAEGAMPPGNYKFMHWSASLSQEEKDSVAAFVDNSLKILAANGITPTPRRPRPEGE